MNNEFINDLKEVFKKHNMIFDISGYEFETDVEEYSDYMFEKFVGSFIKKESEHYSNGLLDNLQPLSTPFLSHIFTGSGYYTWADND